MRTRSIAILVAAVIAAVAPAAVAQPRPGNRVGDKLLPNQSLLGNRTDYIGSTLDNFQLIMQPDCNLVLYNGPRALWNSGSNGKGNGCHAIMQTYGNFVVYNDRNQPVWACMTQGHPGAFVVMQNDGNLVVYNGSQPLWATMTNGQGFDILSIPMENFTSITWRIDRPNVMQHQTGYPQITFKPGDSVAVDAGGCVQTGGMGSTWKRYVDPSSLTFPLLLSAWRELKG
jgi:hypothetical protein